MNFHKLRPPCCVDVAMHKRDNQPPVFMLDGRGQLLGADCEPVFLPFAPAAIIIETEADDLAAHISAEYIKWMQSIGYSLPYTPHVGLDPLKDTEERHEDR